MDEALRKEILRGELKKKNKGKSIVPAKYKMKYPDSAEREYMRMVNAYMAIEKEALLEYIPELKQILNDGTKYNADAKKDNDKKRRTARVLSIKDTVDRLDELFEKIERQMESSFGIYNLKHSLEKIASLDHKLTVSEWKKMLNKTLGINILDDYYSGEFYQEMLGKWVSANVDLIKSVPSESLTSLKEKIYSDFVNGRSTTDIVKELQNQYGMDKRHAKLIARDQTAKLNAQITKSQQKDAGVTKYKWSTSRDERVRESHAALEGKIFSWDNPPETDGGRHCHPGEDYQCRCCALPVFDIDNVDLPM